MTTIMQSWAHMWPKIRSTVLDNSSAGIIDKATFNTIEIDELFDSVNYASTLAGQTVLYRSLAQPLRSIDDIEKKQLAVKEVIDNSELREFIEQVVSRAGADELGFYQLLYGKFLGTFGSAREDSEIEGFGYVQFKKGTRFMLELVAHISQADLPKSAYLQEIFRTIKTFTNSRAYSLMQGPAYISERGIQTKEQRKGSFIPAIIFKPSLFKPLLIMAIFITFLVLGMFVPIFSPVSAIFLAPLLLIYVPIVGGFDRDSCIIPLRDEFINSSELAETLDALGQLDELLSIIKFSESYGSSMVLPEILNTQHHSIVLKNAKNPILGKANGDYVGNDFALEKEKLVFVTGPNSGGKTAFCKTLTQIQLLTQIGGFVPAESAKLAVADRIFYQTPEISRLDDGEGRFGTELKRTKEIFLATTAKSLVILDELSEGTTFEEKMESSSNVLNGFYQIGNNTILITHNHQLVDHFSKKSVGLCKQVEFANNGPTYKLISGISRVSHADRVAKKIGFSKEDIDAYLANEPKTPH